VRKLIAITAVVVCLAFAAAVGGVAVYVASNRDSRNGVEHIHVSSPSDPEVEARDVCAHTNAAVVEVEFRDSLETNTEQFDC
jgi:hypothetical protein